MTASLETLVIAAYVFAESLRIPRPGPAGETTDAELIALAVAQAATGISSDRQFLGVIAKLLPGWFAHLPDQSQFNRRLRRLTPQITTVQLQVAELVAEGRVRARGLRLQPFQEPVHLGHAAGLDLRSKGSSRWL